MSNCILRAFHAIKGFDFLYRCYSPEDAGDVNNLREQGVKVFVSLVPLSKIVEAEAEELGILIKDIFIDDYSCPNRQQIDEYIRFLEEQRLLNRKTVVFCEHGHGRTGTMIALWLVHNGYEPIEAFLAVGGLEKDCQESCVREYYYRLQLQKRVEQS